MQGGAPDFTEQGLIQLLSTLTDAGYIFTAFTPEVPEFKTVILRHDIDLDVESALTTARIEADLGVSATYFVLLSADVYNPLARRNREAIDEFMSLGHRVELHFDPTVYGPSIEEFEEGLTGEAAILESLTGKPTTAFSFHRPRGGSQKFPPTKSGLINAYAPTYFSEICYSSDSDGWWRFGAFVDSENFQAGRSLQLLLHPEWWTGLPSEHPGDRLERLIDCGTRRLRDDFIATIDPFGPHLEGLGHDAGAWPADHTLLRPGGRS